MRIHEILIESRSADLYHGTNLEAAEEIIQDNVMRAHTARQDLENKNLGKAVSFTRDFSIALRFGKEQGSDSDPAVVFVIDQEKLYRAVGKRMQPYAFPPDYDNGNEPDEPSYRSQNAGEAEENILGDINNISSFIKQIIIFMPEGFTKKQLYYYYTKEGILSDPRTKIVRLYNDAITGRQFQEIMKKEMSKEKSKKIIKP